MSDEVVETEKKAIVSGELMAQVMELCLGGMIEKVSTDEEQENAFNLMKLVKQTAIDLEAEYKAKSEPLMAEVEALRAEYFPLLKQLTGEKRDNKGGVTANLSRVIAEYQMEKDRVAKEEADKQQAAIDEENARLAKIESDKAEEADKLRKEAEQTDDVDTLVGLLRAAEEADKTALEASKKLSEAVEAPVVTPKVVYKPAGLKVEMAYTAKVSDYWKAMIWLVNNEGRGHIEGRSDFKKAVDAAMNAVAKIKGINFKADGCTRVDTPKGK